MSTSKVEAQFLLRLVTIRSGLVDAAHHMDRLLEEFGVVVNGRLVTDRVASLAAIAHKDD